MLTIATCTAKRDPKLEWLADSIAIAIANYEPRAFEWVVIDLRLWYEPNERREYLVRIVDGRFPVTHAPPKPTAWQGPARIVERDTWALSNARNSALVIATAPRILWLDDCSLVLPSIVATHLAHPEAAIAACWRYYLQAKVAGGRLWSGLHKDHDPRRLRAEGPLPGDFLYGSNTSYPLEAILAINGYDEVYDGQWGAEDNDRGTRLERAGTPILLDKAITQFLAEDNQERPPSVPTAFTKSMTSENMQLLEQTRRDKTRTAPRGNPFDLRAMRSHWQRTHEYLPHELALQRNDALRLLRKPPRRRLA